MATRKNNTRKSDATPAIVGYEDKLLDLIRNIQGGERWQYGALPARYSQCSFGSV